MIRKAIIVLLALGALGTYLLSFADYSFRWWERNGAGKVVGDITVVVKHGSVIISKRDAFNRTTPAWPRDISLPPAGGRFSYARYVPHQIHRDAAPSYTMNTVTQINLAFVFVVFALYPTIAFLRGPLRRWRRRRNGLCIKCGYDLRGNVTETCPECGTAQSRRDERL